MSMTAAKILLLTAVAALCAQTVVSCMCMPEHPQTSFCKSHFVFRGKIEDKFTIYNDASPPSPHRITYLVKPQPIYRNQGIAIRLRKGEAVNVTTSGYDSMCGAANMEKDEIYLITAKEEAGEVRINLCSWNARFGDITFSQKSLLKPNSLLQNNSFYNMTCAQTPQCEIRKYCGAPHPSQCGQFAGCYFYEDNDCDVQHSYCTWTNGKCDWRRDPSNRKSERLYNNCLEP